MNNIKFEDIVYEHCSFFNPKSIRYLLTQYACESIRIEKVFQDQYMWIAAEMSQDERPRLITEYQEKEAELIGKWRKFLLDADQEHSTVYVWGAGAKGVAFANLLDPTIKYIQAIVDINPKKSGKYLSGTGHKIISPEECAQNMPEKVIVMNENYFEEISSYLNKANQNKRDLQIVSI